MKEIDRSPEAILARVYAYSKDGMDASVSEMLLLMEKYPEKVTGKKGFSVGGMLNTHKKYREFIEDELKAAGMQI